MLRLLKKKLEDCITNFSILIKKQKKDANTTGDSTSVSFHYSLVISHVIRAITNGIMNAVPTRSKTNLVVLQ
jgi:hypothetical protein